MSQLSCACLSAAVIKTINAGDNGFLNSYVCENFCILEMITFHGT